MSPSQCATCDKLNEGVTVQSRAKSCQNNFIRIPLFSHILSVLRNTPYSYSKSLICQSFLSLKISGWLWRSKEQHGMSTNDAPVLNVTRPSQAAATLDQQPQQLKLSRQARGPENNKKFESKIPLPPNTALQQHVKNPGPGSRITSDTQRPKASHGSL